VNGNEHHRFDRTADPRTKPTRVWPAEATSEQELTRLAAHRCSYQTPQPPWYQLDALASHPQAGRDGERDPRRAYDGNPSFFKDHELYLLRNMSRGRGIGFFEAGNFYPDFLLWLLTADKQYVTFVDPKGIRNLEGPDDPKIRFYRTIKELEARLGDPSVILNSFIISNTPFQQVRWWTEDLSKDQFTKAHVLFQKEDRSTYIKRLLTTAVSNKQVTIKI